MKKPILSLLQRSIIDQCIGPKLYDSLRSAKETVVFFVQGNPFLFLYRQNLFA